MRTRNFYIITILAIAVLMVALATEAHAAPIGLVPDHATPQMPKGSTVWTISPARGRATADVYVGAETPDGSGTLREITENSVPWITTPPGGGIVYSSIVIDGELIIGTDTAIIAYDDATHQQLWMLPVDGRVTTLKRNPAVPGMVLAGGDLTGVVRALDITGHWSDYPIPAITGRHDGPAGPTHVYRSATAAVTLNVGTTDYRYVGVGEFTAVDGQPRNQVFMLSLNSMGATLLPWHPSRFDPQCSADATAYVRDVKFSPDGQSVAIVSTGGGHRNDSSGCDALVVASSHGVMVQHVLKTDRDSFHSVEWCPNSRCIFVQGHFKSLAAKEWTSGPLPVQLPRFGIALVDVASDGALTTDPWKSDKCRGVGGRALQWAKGLWVGYNCPYWGNSEGINPDPTPQTKQRSLAYLPNILP